MIQFLLILRDMGMGMIDGRRNSKAMIELQLALAIGKSVSVLTGTRSETLV